MSDISMDHAAEARAALQAIVSDPDHGTAALSSAQTMSNLLKDLLPDAPREKSLLVAAAEAGLATSLREHVEQGMDPATAMRLTSSSFSATTPYPPAACDWATSEIAIALGVSKPGEAAGPGQGLPASPGLHQVNTQAIPGLAGYQPARQPPPAAPFAPPPSGQPLGPAQQAAMFPPSPAPFGAAPGGFPAQDPRFTPVPQYYTRPKNNNLAVAAMLCGIGQFIGWFIFLLPGLVAALLALIFGIVSMRQMRLSGEAGRGMAVTGVVLGSLGVFGGISLILLATIGALSSHSS
jgi:Domain of unknown function (DUF4190)